MDLGKFLDGLADDVKTVLIILCLDFSLAYVDCWKLSPGFRDADVLPQVFLASGDAVIFAMGGITFNLIVRRSLGIDEYNNDLYASVLPFVVGTFAAFFTPGYTPGAFLIVVVGWCILLVCPFIAIRHYKAQKDARDKHDSRGEHHGSEV